jgi:hypothetical protein
VSGVFPVNGARRSGDTLQYVKGVEQIIGFAVLRAVITPFIRDKHFGYPARQDGPGLSGGCCPSSYAFGSR